MKNWNELLGFTVIEKITGFSGVVVGVVGLGAALGFWFHAPVTMPDPAT